MRLLRSLLIGCLILSASGLYGQAIQVTTEAGHPTVSPDGQWVAFALNSGGIGKCRTDGTDLTTILAESAFDPDWSWAHNLLVFRNYDTLFSLNPNSGAHSPVFVGTFDDDPTWSADGTKIAVQNSSPDGIRIIAYPSGAYTDLPCSDPDGTGCDGEVPTWSPDGQWIAFEDGMDIMKVPAGGGTAVSVLGGLSDVSSPSWSPDGQWIAFVMDSGYYVPNPEEPWNMISLSHIWIADARGMAYGYRQITSGLVADRRPTWSPDADTIFFSRSGLTTIGIWKISIGPCCQGTTGNVDGDPGDIADISDLMAMVDYLFFSGALSDCPTENDVDISGSVDISDLQALVDFLFFGATLPNCP